QPPADVEGVRRRRRRGVAHSGRIRGVPVLYLARRPCPPLHDLGRLGTDESLEPVTRRQARKASLALDPVVRDRGVLLAGWPGRDLRLERIREERGLRPAFPR